MFRITNFMREVVWPSRIGPARKPPGPVVIWNLTRRCNLRCRFCYSGSADVAYADELSTDEVVTVMQDLRAFRVPALILSGGEPLLRPDIFELSAEAKRLGFYVALSTNGTRIDETNIERIAELDYDYVGISLDGTEPTHDHLRGEPGAFAAAMRGVERCQAIGIKVGLRFTLTRDNAAELSTILDLIDRRGIDKFYLSHLNYGGRGFKVRGEDAQDVMTRDALELIFETCLRHINEGRNTEFVTGNNDADGVFLLHWVRKNFPARAAHIQALLERWGGNASGVNVANWKTAVYALGGLFSGLAGVVIASRLNSAQPALGVGYELDAIAAVVIGGTSLSGGQGTILGTIIGAFIISTLTNGLRIMSVPQEWQMVVTGTIVILAVYLDIVRRSRQ